MMKPLKQRLAPFGLYLALAAVLVSGGLFIVQRSFTLPLQISIGLIVVGVAAFALLNPARFRAFLTGRQARYGSNALIKTLAFSGILIVINYLAFQYSPRWDLTEDSEHTLAPETVETLESLEQPVAAQAFFTSQFPASVENARKILESYKVYGKGNFDYQFIDPEADPFAAQAAGITRDGTIVLKMADRQEQVAYIDEQEITSALIRLGHPGERVVYFLTGRGEYDPKTSGESSYSMVNQMLENKNYTVLTLNLLTNPTIPEDALSLVIAGARKAYSEKEVNLIRKYVDNGGSLIVLAEPVLMEEDQDNNVLNQYLEEIWGIIPENNVIIDPNVNPSLIAISDSYGNHPITERLLNRATIFPTARSLRTESVGENISQQEIIYTSQTVWGETDIENLRASQVSADQGADALGPLPIAVTATNLETQARLVVVGDADFASDRYIYEFWNTDLIINIIDWASRQDSLINLTSRQPTVRMLIPPRDYVMGLLLLGLVFVIPGAVVVTGIATWVQRRRRG